jgi:hypothetical protein
MSQTAYDISYLLEAELAQFSTPAVRVEKPVPPPRVVEPDIAEIEAATARELIAMDAAHEAFIQQFMQFGGRFS